MADLPTPVTRNEEFLNAIALGDPSGLPDPITREELYLAFIANNGGGGGGTGDVSGVKGAVEENYRKGFVNLTLPNVANVGNGLEYDSNNKTLKGTQYETIPTPANIFIGKIIQYVGEDSGNYHSGRFYKCESDGWHEVNMGGSEVDPLTAQQVNALLNLL